MDIDTMNWLGGLFSRYITNKVIVPSGFHERAEKVREMFESDNTGLVTSLTDFQVKCACTPTKISTGNAILDQVLNTLWLPYINSAYRGTGVEKGITGLKKECLKEMVQGAGFPCLKIIGWDKVGKLLLPTKMAFCRGSSIHVRSSDGMDTVFGGSTYFLGQGNDAEEIKPNGAYFLYKPNARWADDYPNPYLIRRGVYQAWKFLEVLQNKQYDLTSGLIPLIMHILKGDFQLEKEGIRTYDKQDFENTKSEIQKLENQVHEGMTEAQLRIKMAQWDEKIEHIVPKIDDMFKRELTYSAEKRILAGLGFIDIVDASTETRRSSVLNPKPFIKDCNELSSYFNMILSDVCDQIKEYNRDELNAIKYGNLNWKVTSPMVVDFVTNEFKTLLRSVSDRGRISDRTFIEVVGEGYLDYDEEVNRSSAELESGERSVLYPKEVTNTEDKTSFLEGMRDEIAGGKEPDNQDDIPDDKKGLEAKNYANAGLKLAGAPWATNEDFISKSKIAPLLTKDMQEVFRKTFNSVYERSNDEIFATKVAWKMVRKLGRKNKKGMWEAKKSWLGFRKAKMSQAMLEQVEQEVVNDLSEASGVVVEEEKNSGSDKMNRLLKIKELEAFERQEKIDEEKLNLLAKLNKTNEVK